VFLKLAAIPNNFLEQLTRNRDMKTAFTVDDLYLHLKATEIDCAPDGSVAACTFRSVDRDNDQYQFAIWSVPLDGGAPIQLTKGSGNTDNTPRWSPDGATLGFISNRSGGLQIYTLARNGGEASQVGNFGGGVSDFMWFPDGKAMVVASGVAVDPELRGGRAAGAAAQKACSPEIAWKLPYKSDGVGYLLGREVRLFRLDLATGEQRQLSDGAFDVLGFDVSPDGRHIAYSRTRAGRFAHCTELWTCDAQGNDHRPLVQHLATVATPVWSPDGRWILFTGAAKEGEGETTLWLHEVATGRTALFGDEAIEVAAGCTPHWSSDGQAIVFSQAYRGRHRIVVGKLKDRTLTTLVAGDRQFGAFACSGERLVYTVESPVLPSEVWMCDPHGEGERKLTDLNAWWRDRVDMKAELRSFDVPDGLGGTEQIEGWLLRRADAQAPGPLLNDVHGGPASYALLDFDTNVFWQVLCSSGWSVLALNAVGSSSYGREFCGRLAGHWGEYDLPQHLAAITSLQAEGICDDRLAISGKSYGGFFSAWTIGHTDLFGAAVVMSPVGNIETHYGTSDGGYYADPFYLGTAPRFDRAFARRLSPLQYVEEAQTPTLFLQGKEDERCPKCQSEELFVSLMRAGDTPAELVLYPGENHSFLGQGKPSCRADASTRIVDWISHHACGQEAASEATVTADADEKAGAV
jgi:dipeptidyl aminopeptidase/acylaminoacyl peptidase